MIALDKIFREYDIRGTVDTDFDKDLAYELGRAYATKVKAAYASESRGLSVAVGRDCRTTGEWLAAALTEGILSQGINVVSSGMGPTPQLYYTVFAKGLDGGIQVTGSHNPPDQNGFKMMIGTHTLSGQDIQGLKQAIQAKDADSYSGEKGAFSEFDARTAYIKELIERSKAHVKQERTLKVVVDGGNGVGGMVAPDVLRGLGCEVIELYTEPDGNFPNHHPDPTVLENIAEIRKRVVSEKADVGIAYDGDADRIGVIDETGEVVWGDMLLLLYGRQLLKEVKKPTIIGDVKCSEVLFSTLREAGANAVMWKTGHSLIKSKLYELNAHLAGEMSGHIFFNHRWYGFDDAIHSSARLVELLSQTTQTVSQLLADLPKTVSTPEIRVDCPEEIKFKIAEQAKDRFPEYETNPIDGVRVTFPHGWGLVRASNTQPVLVLRFEADNEERLAEYQRIVEEQIESLKKELS